jgi:hypothetical protein
MRKDLKLNTEYPPPEEQELAATLVDLIRKSVEERFLQGMTYRGVNTKSHVAAQATLTVDQDLPSELRVGLFKEPRTYPVWIRFSSTLPDPKPDIVPDLRGMALKLMEVEGETLLESDPKSYTHDMIFITVDTFFTSVPQDFLKFMKAGGISSKKTPGSMIALLWFILTHPAVGACILRSWKKFGSLLEVPWYTATPYLFGERAAKLSLWPKLPAVTPVPDKPSNNYLREGLARQLKAAEASFDLRVQFQLDPYKQPIEDALVSWREQDSPWHTIATLTIPVQEVDTPEQLMFCENLSMNPWRCLPEHRPLGGINRVRRLIYSEGSKYRHYKNAVPVTEPKP